MSYVCYFFGWIIKTGVWIHLLSLLGFVDYLFRLGASKVASRMRIFAVVRAGSVQMRGDVSRMELRTIKNFLDYELYKSV